MYQNLLHATKAALRGKSAALNFSFRKEGSLKIDDWSGEGYDRKRRARSMFCRWD